MAVCSPQGKPGGPGTFSAYRHWCFWEQFPHTCSFHLLHPAKAPLGPIVFPTLAEEVMDFLSAAELWACLQ